MQRLKKNNRQISTCQEKIKNNIGKKKIDVKNEKRVQISLIISNSAKNKISAKMKPKKYQNSAITNSLINEIQLTG